MDDVLPSKGVIFARCLTLLEQGNKVAGRLFITTKRPNEEAQEIEVMLIAEYKGNKLYRVWELTYPDWSKMKAFKKVAKY